MTSQRLNDELSFCRIDGRPIFLDTRNDRYFRLSSRLEHVFDAYIEGVELSAEDAARLIEANVLTVTPPDSKTRTNGQILTASRSALELSSPPTPRFLGAFSELLVTVFWTQLQLKTRHLKAILEDTVSYRSRKQAVECCNSEQPAVINTHVFLKARKLVPIETCCLLDSLSMIRFLARRRVHANVIFGVTNDPFTAHCWVQTGDLVLNDSLGNTRAYSVIRVI